MQASKAATVLMIGQLPNITPDESGYRVLESLGNIACARWDYWQGECQESYATAFTWRKNHTWENLMDDIGRALKAWETWGTRHTRENGDYYDDHMHWEMCDHELGREEALALLSDWLGH